MSSEHDYDKRTGRPLTQGFEAVASLSDTELEAELQTAAAATNHRRLDRYERLLRERGRREQRSDIVLVLATGAAEARSTFAAELARLLGAAHIDADALATAGQIQANVVATVADMQLRAGISAVVDASIGPELESELHAVQRNHPDVPVVRVQALEGQALSPDRVADEVWGRVRRSERH